MQVDRKRKPERSRRRLEKKKNFPTHGRKIPTRRRREKPRAFIRGHPSDPAGYSGGGGDNGGGNVRARGPRNVFTGTNGLNVADTRTRSSSGRGGRRPRRRLLRNSRLHRIWRPFETPTARAIFKTPTYDGPGHGRYRRRRLPPLPRPARFCAAVPVCPAPRQHRGYGNAFFRPKTIFYL